MIRLSIPGIAEPKGSYRVARGQLIPAGDPKSQARLRTWHDTVVAAARLTFGTTTPRWPTRAVWIAAIFSFPVRLGDFTDDGEYLRDAAPWMLIAKRDGDKLLRHLGDALTDSKCVWRDDGQAQIAGVARVYLPPGQAVASDLFLGAEDELDAVQVAWRARLVEAKEAIEAAKRRRKAA